MMLSIILLFATLSNYRFSVPTNATTSTPFPSKSVAAQTVPKTADIAFLAETSLATICMRDIPPADYGYWKLWSGWTRDFHPMKRSYLSDIARACWYASKPIRDASSQFCYSSDADWVAKGCKFKTDADLTSLSWPSGIRTGFLENYSSPTWVDGNADMCYAIANTNRFPNKADLKTLFDTINECTKANKLFFYAWPSGIKMRTKTGRILMSEKDVDYLSWSSSSSSGGDSDITDGTPSTIVSTNGVVNNGVEIAYVSAWFLRDLVYKSDTSGKMTGENANIYMDWISNKNESTWNRMETEDLGDITVTLFSTNLTDATSPLTITAYAVIQYGCYEDGISWASFNTDAGSWNCRTYNVSLGKNEGQSIYRYCLIPVTLTRTEAAPDTRDDAGRWTYRISGLSGLGIYNTILKKLGYEKFNLSYYRTSYLTDDEWTELGVPYFAVAQIPSSTIIGPQYASSMEQYMTFDIQIWIYLYGFVGFVDFTPTFQY